MGSVAAKAVAAEVLESIARGEKPSVSKIAVRKGYSPKTAKSGLIQKTKTFQAELRPLVERLAEERDAILLEMKKKRPKARYADLSNGLDRVSKQLALLTGGATENIQQRITVVRYAQRPDATA